MRTVQYETIQNIEIKGPLKKIHQESGKNNQFFIVTFTINNQQYLRYQLDNKVIEKIGDIINLAYETKDSHFSSTGYEFIIKKLQVIGKHDNISCYEPITQMREKLISKRELKEVK